MSPASKSKSKDKLGARAVEEQKTSLKFTHALDNSESTIPGSAYSPVLGTFHALETEQSASIPSPQNSGRFQNIDETDDHSGSSPATSDEYDSLSNNSSCSGESEDHKKTKIVTIPQTESIPGCDTDKRDKVRQKNERKHQRQKERRAQEMHERCNSFLMSRKLEALAQKFVAMGISSERATMSLILNEGRVEESVAWLFEGSEDGKQQSVTNLDGADLKIDIAEELAEIAALEVKYNCTKHEVERAVVACDGDLEKAEDALKVQKQEPTVAPPLPEHSGDPIVAANDISNELKSPVQNPAGRISVKRTAPMSIQQQGRVATVPYIELASRNMQASSGILTKQEQTIPQVAALLDKRQPTRISSPSASYSLGPPLQAAIPRANPVVRYVTGGGHEVKTNMQATAMLKEPIVMLQRSQSNALKQRHPSTSIGLSVSPPASTGWYPNSSPSTEVMKTAAAYGGLGHKLRNPSLGGSTSQQLYPQNQYQPFVSGPMEPGVPGWSGTWSTKGTCSIKTPSSIALPSSLGLFTGWGSSASSGLSSPVNWSTGGLMSQCDYNSIDWTLDSTLLGPTLKSSNQLYEYDAWSRKFLSTKELRPANNVYLGGLQEGKFVADPSSEWTSAFNGRDLFGAPRQFVTYPSL